MVIARFRAVKHAARQKSMGPDPNISYKLRKQRKTFAGSARAQISRDIKALEKRIEDGPEKILQIKSATVLRAHERKVGRMEREKFVLAEGPWYSDGTTCWGCSWMADLLEHFAVAVDRHPDRTAPTESDGREVTFREVKICAQQLARKWRRKGLGHGDRVLLAMPVKAEFYASLVDLWSFGATVVLPEPAMGIAGVAPRGGVPSSRDLKEMPHETVAPCSNHGDEV
ncbi:hypothetical protein So717_05350 [Roseobacter cerasinus]|uniref:AMP-dependent synthetase/ligase domain-containing protein n=1 Tax=Roseobacter cerasinus TaxID=2602289 RepID=A0A640VM42_9RHOB|nr:AMP-binding protein [Roseobacter cerasinus]GFE48782.1 hypothetical protein So717_05350 [Roseobacter cerasinus]